MARAALKWRDDALRTMLQAIESAHHTYPDDNDLFLDTLIAEITTVTGRIYGQSTYDRLIRTTLDSQRIKRRPSAPTVQKAIARAQARATGVHVKESGGWHAPDAEPLDVSALRRALTPVVQKAIAPVRERLDRQAASAAPAAATPVAGQAFQLKLTQSLLDDARQRMRAFETEISRLQRELGSAEARAASAETQAAVLLEKILDALRESADGAEALAQVAMRLDTTERFLKQRNDAVHLQATTEIDALRRKNQELGDALAQLQIENDQYRRMLTGQRVIGSDTR
jgi:hypothetical protein